MYINNETNNGYVGIVNPNQVSMPSTNSGEFLQALSKQMEEWVRAMSDNKITQNEISNINGMIGGGAAGKLFAQAATDGESDTSATVYDGASASLYASTQVSQIANLMTWIFSFTTQQNELYTKAAGMLSG